jgi:hypothetical protein
MSGKLNGPMFVISAKSRQVNRLALLFATIYLAAKKSAAEAEQIARRVAAKEKANDE